MYCKRRYNIFEHYTNQQLEKYKKVIKITIPNIFLRIIYFKTSLFVNYLQLHYFCSKKLFIKKFPPRVLQNSKTPKSHRHFDGRTVLLLLLPLSSQSA